MEKDSAQLKAAIDYDLASKGVAPAIAFSAVAVAVYFQGFSTQQHLLELRIFCGAIVIISIYRFLLARQVSNAGVCSARQGLLYRVVAWSTGVGWGSVLALGSWEAGFDVPSASIRLILMAGFVSGSVVTLGLARFTHLGFTVVMVGPQIVLSVVKYFEGEKNASMVFVSALVFAIYTIQQASLVRKQLKGRFQSQIDLEETNRQLKESRAELVRNTAKTQHTARLATVGVLASGVAHEINNPLSVISGNLSLAQNSLKKGEVNPEEMSRRIEKSLAAVQRAVAIVQSLRRFARKEEEDEKVLVPLSEILRDTLDFCKERYRAHGIEILLPEDSHLNQRIHCRPVQISQILVNLLNNAFDALTDSKTLPTRIVLSVRDEANSVIISVSNPGPPLSASVREHLFSPFFTTKQVGKGTGLGLSISRELALEHRGELYLDTESAETTFCLKLPKASVAA